MKRTTLALLIDKYSRMHAMRICDDPDPREAMRELARDYPGALREIDRRSLGTLTARVEILREAELGSRKPPDWAYFWAEYHATMRVILRRRFPGHSDPRDDEPDPNEIDWSALDDCEERTSIWVARQIAHRHGVADECVLGELFPPLEQD